MLRILAALDGHFAADDCSPAGADRWRELKRQLQHMRDGLDLARIQLDRKAPEASKGVEARPMGPRRGQ